MIGPGCEDAGFWELIPVGIISLFIVRWTSECTLSAIEMCLRTINPVEAHFEMCSNNKINVDTFPNVLPPVDKNLATFQNVLIFFPLCSGVWVGGARERENVSGTRITVPQLQLDVFIQGQIPKILIYYTLKTFRKRWSIFIRASIKNTVPFSHMNFAHKSMQIFTQGAVVHWLMFEIRFPDNVVPQL